MTQSKCCTTQSFTEQLELDNHERNDGVRGERELGPVDAPGFRRLLFSGSLGGAGAAAAWGLSNTPFLTLEYSWVVSCPLPRWRTTSWALVNKQFKSRQTTRLKPKIYLVSLITSKHEDQETERGMKMMSTLNSSMYRQHIDGLTFHNRTRPAVVGAPYVLCVFVVGVVLLGVGTFVTSHGHREDGTTDPALLVVGPVLLGLGSMLLLGSVLLCVVACCRNRQLREALSDELYTIGASTFYSGKRLMPSDGEKDDDVDRDPPRYPLSYPGAAMRGIENPSGPHHPQTQAVMFLANTVTEERNRQQRKASTARKYSRYLSQEPSGHLEVSRGHHYFDDPHHQAPLTPRSDLRHLDHLGLDRLRRVDPQLQLTYGWDGMTPEEVLSGQGARERASSMSVRLTPTTHVMGPTEHRLRRNITYSAASRHRVQQQRQMERRQLYGSQQLPVASMETVEQQQQQYPPPPPPPGPLRRKRSSRRGSSKGKDSPATPKILPLPKFDPELIRALGIETERPQMTRGISEEGILDHSAQRHHSDAWRHDPAITHGSLGSPRRRPSVAMGVRGKKVQQMANRPIPSMNSSDIDLYRESSGMTTNRQQTLDPSSSHATTLDVTTDTGAAGLSSRTGSSPVLCLPPPDGIEPLSLLDTQREENSDSDGIYVGKSRDTRDSEGQYNKRKDSKHRHRRKRRDTSDSERQYSRRGNYSGSEHQYNSNKREEDSDNLGEGSTRGGPPSSLRSSPSPTSIRPLSSISSESCCSDCYHEGDLGNKNLGNVDLERGDFGDKDTGDTQTQLEEGRG
ncbi:hypothetical protein Pmani_025647 [Petrolisthes manimaculis]|uniref:Uncharacterized protein n=1 Tax=Petrolisthes manimaculis TaxID=1843537 RepID=A0AAE1P7S9_9EUCA|nr:hypothetical protein Pmani_025647 [Petrolisthes manimaculis]